MGHTASVLQAVAESMDDGLLVVSASDQIIHRNRRFLELWSVPEPLTKAGEDGPMLRFVAAQVKDPDQFLGRVRQIYRSADRAVDTLELKDGRYLERISYPLPGTGGREAGRLWVFRDVTTRKREETALARRLVALSQPVDDPNPIGVEELFNLEELQRIQDAFAEATGVASIITHANGEPITRASNFCRLCSQVIRATERGRRNCQTSDAALGCHHPEGPVVQPCLSGGLWDAGASIEVGGRHVASWLIGQVRNDTQTEEQMRAYAREIGANEDEMAAAFREVPTMSRAQFEQVARALFLFANQLSKTAYQNLQQARFIAERERTEAALQASERKLAEIFRSSPEMIVVTQRQTGLVLDVNAACLRMLGYPREELIGRTTAEINVWETPAERERVVGLVRASGGVAQNVEVKFRGRDGSLVDVALSMAAVVLDGQPCLLTIAADLTERRRAEQERLELERRLLHAQKLESLGVLAGGIAHDFNNLLMAILGNLDLALVDLPAVSPARESVEQGVVAARRAADLTRQMLAYSGRGRIHLSLVDLSQLVEENVHLFRTCIARRIGLKVQFGRALPAINVDPGQVQQVIMNLITNAAEAIGDLAGSITLTTSVEVCAADYLRRGRVEVVPAAGRFVCLEVVDTGCGMDADTQQRLFDPFFTTKFTGRGLGMATLLGIVRGHRGTILVDSAVGRGTTIRVLFPATDTVLNPIAETKAPTQSHEGKRVGSILVVDDEDMVRQVCQRMLRQFGWPVIAAANGPEAIALFRSQATSIAGVLLDLSMPEMDGLAVARELRVIRPDIKIILSSGYSSDQGMGQTLAAENFAGFIQKPYTVEALRQEVDRVIASGPARPPLP